MSDTAVIYFFPNKYLKKYLAYYLNSQRGHEIIACEHEAFNVFSLLS